MTSRPAQSLADLYNARRAQESGPSAPSASARTFVNTDRSSASAPPRKPNRPAATSLADLYNQRYESEQDHPSQSRSFFRSAPRPPRSATQPRAISIDSSSDASLVPATAYLQTESEELEDEDSEGVDEDADMSMDAHAPRRHAARSDSQARSEFVSLAPSTSRVVYIPRTTVPRRGALNSSGALLLSDSDEDHDRAASQELELPSASASSNQLARPHPSPSKLVVQSNSELDAETESSELPIPPRHRKHPAISSEMIADTEDGSETEAGLTRRHLPHTGSDDALDVVVVDDSSVDEDDRPEEPIQIRHDALRIVLAAPGQRIGQVAAEFGSSDVSRSRGSHPSSDPLVPYHSGLQAGRNFSGIEVDDSSAGATPATGSDSEAHRRYPKRARNVTDYNVRRHFERYELQRAQEQLAQATQLPRGRPNPLPFVAATPKFLDLLRSRAPRTAKVRSRPPSSFAQFLLTKARSDAALAASSVPAAATRSTQLGSALTEAKARELPSREMHPAALWDVPVRTNREQLALLRLSTRRALGLAGEPAVSPTLSDPSLPPPPAHKVKLVRLLRRQRPLRGSQLRAELESHVGEGRVGRPSDSEGLESVDRFLRAGRSCRLPLPDALSPLVDMERKEWLRLDESLPDLERMAEEDRARERGIVLVDVEDTECVTTQIDSAGRKRFAKVRCATGGELRVYYDLSRSDAAIPQAEGEEQRMEIVRTVSPAKSSSATRLAGSQPRSIGDREVREASSMYDEETAMYDDEMPMEEEEASEDEGVPSVLEVSPEPMDEEVAGQKHADSPSPPRSVQPAGPFQVSRVAQSGGSSARASTSQIRGGGGKSPRDLLSYFAPQRSPARAHSPPAPHRPGPRSASSAVAQGKQRALDEVEVWDSDEASQSQNVEVVLDVARPAALRETIGTPRKRPRSPDAAAKKLSKHGERATTTVRPAHVGSTSTPEAEPKRKKLPHAAERAAAKGPKMPKATPSPSRGGWKGISSWYTDRDAFTPTPDTPRRGR